MSVADKSAGKRFTIDMTPSWEGLLPIYLEALNGASTTSAICAREELVRMAKLADSFAALQKATGAKA